MGTGERHRTEDHPDLRHLLRAVPHLRDLASIDAKDTPGALAGKGKPWGKEQLRAVGTELARYQEMLYAQARVARPDTPQARRRVLLVLQGMDCSGKGGTVRNLGRTMNPVGLRVATFGAPSESERRQHFLVRVRRALPPYGMVGFFDRSHYEDVLAARVRALVPESEWQRRYDEINEWEDELTRDGVSIVKVLLHISYEEQTRRLASRLDNPHKHWKFSPVDIDDRHLWDAYQDAYAEVLRRCHTERSPWYVVPADRKWYRDWAVAMLLLATLRDLDLRYPDAHFDVAEQRRRLARTAFRGR